MPLSFRTHIGARRVDEQRAVLHRPPAREREDVAALGLDRNRKAGHRRNRPAAGAGAVDERAAGDARAVLQTHGDDGGAVALDRGHLALHVFGAERARLLAEGLEQAPAVEPAFARAAPGAGGEILRVEPGEALLQRGRIEIENVGALGRLERVVLGEDRRAGLRRAIEIAALLQPDLRTLAIDRETVADAAQEIDSVERDADVHRARILLADRGRRQGRGRELVGGILLDHDDAPLEAGIGEQVIGRGRTHDGAADDHDIGLHDIGLERRC